VSDPHVAVKPSATHATAAALDESSTIAIAHISSIESERIGFMLLSVNRCQIPHTLESKSSNGCIDCSGKNDNISNIIMRRMEYISVETNEYCR
jgi:hypothetical protein